MDARGRADAVGQGSSQRSKQGVSQLGSPEWRAQLRDELSIELAGSGVMVEDVAVFPAGRRRLVRVTVARDISALDPADETTPVEPVTLDEIADVTRMLSATLDATEAMAQTPYTLEVSSPGVDQPLVTPAQLRRNVGRLVAVDLHEGAPVQGRLVGVGAEGIRLDGDRDTVVPFEAVARARVHVEFSRPDATPGAGPAAGKDS